MSSPIIDFGNGQPSLSLLPVQAIREAAAHALDRDGPALLQYGADEGDAGFRAALAAFLARRSATPVEAEQLFATGGASQALDLVCTCFTKPGDTILVEEPTYFLALEVFRDHGLQVIGVPLDEDGLRIDALQQAITRHRPVLLYTIPSFQNPTGTTLSAPRRAQLAAVSRTHDLLIVADEVYHLLDFGAPPPPSLGSMAGSARILSLGSFSKICAPGLRLGWVQGAPALLDRLVHSGLVQSGGGLSPFPGGVVRSLLELGLADRVLDTLRDVYTARSAALCHALRAQLPRASFVEPRGGYFVWLELPDTVRATDLLPVAREMGVSFHPGRRFVSDDQFAQALRLSFAHYDEPMLLEGVRRLALAVAAC
jgi:2-aminoadipate transaminase